MPTNEERREVARKLRECADKYIWVDVRLVADILGSSIEENHLSNELYCGTVEDIADLIEPEPERTCTPVLDDQGWMMWRCPECGQSINRADNYCSSCGVKVTPTPL